MEAEREGDSRSVGEGAFQAQFVSKAAAMPKTAKREILKIMMRARSERASEE